EKIIAVKIHEVAALKKEHIVFPDYPAVPTLESQLRSKDTMGIIAEIKRASPSKGLINGDVVPAEQAKLYEKHGANAISVLTDKQFFQGSMDDLRAVRSAVNVPILCKDFIIDEIQIDLARAAGANIILLIAAALDDETMTRLYRYAV